MADEVFELTGDRILKIFLDLILPHDEILMSEIELKKCSNRFLWSGNLDVGVRDE